MDVNEAAARHRTLGIVWAVAYIATIFAANWSIQNLGACSGQGPCTIPVWPGIAAPSGVLWAGLAFTLRDLVQDHLGRIATVVAIVIGAALSALISAGGTVPGGVMPLALASGTAFLVSELADFAVYTPLRERNWLGAVAASNVVGFVADSALFLFLAFGSLEFLAGQLIGKGWMTLLAVAVLWPLRRQREQRAARAAAVLPSS